VGDAKGRVGGQEGPRRRRLRLEGELQLPRGGGDGADHRGRGGSGSAPRSGGSPARRQAVIEQRKYRPRAWSGIHGFGSGWRVEGVFSAMKRIFGEYVTAGKFANMVKEMIMKAFIYNIFIAQI